ncbi:SRPBCC family protein [soil metagenome]
MTAPRIGTLPDDVSLHVAATPERLYALLTDVAGMGRLSPECTGGRWLDGAAGPVVGARFKGTNKRGPARWSTTNTVVVAEPGRAFAFETKQSGTRWRFDLAPDAGGQGTVVTESRAEFAPRSFVAKAFATVLLGGVASHEDEVRKGMAATLERLKALAEAS